MNYREYIEKRFSETYAICKADETGKQRNPCVPIESPCTPIERPCVPIERPCSPIESPCVPIDSPCASSKVTCPYMTKKTLPDYENIDFREYGWKIIRNGGTRAIVCPGGKNDTIKTLAEKIGLDESESAKWLLDANGKGVTVENFTYRQLYTIPNIFVIAVSWDDRFSTSFTLRKWGLEFQKCLEENGVNVFAFFQNDDNSSKNSVIRVINMPDTAGYTFMGHGNSPERISWWKGRELDTALARTAGSFIYEEYAIILPSDIFLHPFKFSVGVHYHCYASSHQWADRLVNSSYINSNLLRPLIYHYPIFIGGYEKFIEKFFPRDNDKSLINRRLMP